MTSPKTIAIVGATGRMGSVIARSLAEARYRLVLTAKRREKLKALKNELVQIYDADVMLATSVRDAAWEADLVVIAVPAEQEVEIAEHIRDVVSGKIIISISARDNRKADISAAEELQRMLPYSRIVKTFNTVHMSTHVSPAVSCKSAVVFVAGNNGEAVSVVTELGKRAGFSPMIVGDLSASRALERMGFQQNQRMTAVSGRMRIVSKAGGHSSGPTIL
ncbi:MAG TPA: NAD(P)-binding domain-containing protein [Cyclobacteriaceae bacterium]|jgi:predicted dinucleotide-binding enzyme